MRLEWNVYGRVSAQNPSALKAAEICEKLAKQSSKKGDKAKAVQQWENAAERYMEACVFDKAIECLENAELLETRVVDLLQVFEPEIMLNALRERGFREELTLARLHLQSRGEAAVEVPADEDCYTWAAAALEEGGNQKLFLQFLKGAVLAASWVRDETHLHQAVDLALKNNLDLTAQAKGVSDRILFLLIEIAVSDEFELIGELSKLAVPSETDRTPHSPFQLRLLAPIYLYRGIMLDTLIDAMRVIPALARYAERYRALFDGIRAGRADEAVESFVSTLTADADRPDPQTPLHTWEDVERRFPNILYAQPEYLAASILQDQVWTTRTGMQELREWIAKASSNPEAQQWTEMKALFESVTSHALFGYLPDSLQAAVYQLGCTAAFHAEDWQQYDRWATTLEEKYTMKDVLRRLVAATSNAGSSEGQQ